MNKNPPGSFEAEWRARFDRFAERGGTSAKISGWSEHGLERRIEEVMAAIDRDPPAPGARFLDLGCGSGIYCLHLRERGFVPLGADFSPGMLGRARAALDAVEGPGAVPLVCADVLRLPFADGVFDGVVNVGVLQHIEDGATALREMVRVLRPGGRLYVVTLNKISLHGIASHLVARLRAWSRGRWRIRQHAIRRRPATFARIAEGAGARVVDLRGVYLFPGPVRGLERVLRRLDAWRWPFSRRPVPLFLANAFLTVVEVPAEARSR
ncbi:MAG: class I SAM-dependent methyltransferase [Planctomycetota bacterium]